MAYVLCGPETRTSGGFSGIVTAKPGRRGKNLILIPASIPGMSKDDPVGRGFVRARASFDIPGSSPGQAQCRRPGQANNFLLMLI